MFFVRILIRAVLKLAHPALREFQSTLRLLIQVRYLEMHSKRRYKICICSVILAEVESFSGFSIIFPKILHAISRFTKVTIFLFPLSVIFLKAKILGFLFSTKNSPTWVVRCEKIKFSQSQEIYQTSLENYIRHDWNGHLDIFRGTQREHSSKPLKHSIVKRILVFERQIQAYFYPLEVFHLFGFPS